MTELIHIVVSVKEENVQYSKHVEESKKEFDESKVFKDKAVTQIIPHTNFWKAEDYHQKYLMKNPSGYMCHFLRER